MGWLGFYKIIVWLDVFLGWFIQPSCFIGCCIFLGGEWYCPVFCSGFGWGIFTAQFYEGRNFHKAYTTKKTTAASWKSTRNENKNHLNQTGKPAVGLRTFSYLFCFGRGISGNLTKKQDSICFRSAFFDQFYPGFHWWLSSKKCRGEHCIWSNYGALTRIPLIFKQI